MTTRHVNGTPRERASVAAMVLVGVALPVIAKLHAFQDIVWIFWLASLVLIVGALALLTITTRRERRSRES